MKPIAVTINTLNVCGYGDMEQAIEQALSKVVSSIEPNPSSAESYPRRNHQEQQTRLSYTFRCRYNALSRILRDCPGCELCLTESGVHIVVDKRGWSQEKRAMLFEALGDFRAQAAKEGISTSTLLVDSNLDRL